MILHAYLISLFKMHGIIRITHTTWRIIDFTVECCKDMVVAIW